MSNFFVVFFFFKVSIFLSPFQDWSKDLLLSKPFCNFVIFKRSTLKTSVELLIFSKYLTYPSKQTFECILMGWLERKIPHFFNVRARLTKRKEKKRKDCIRAATINQIITGHHHSYTYISRLWRSRYFFFEKHSN